jgi:hypothetical protein
VKLNVRTLPLLPILSVPLFNKPPTVVAAATVNAPPESIVTESMLNAVVLFVTLVPP